MGTNPITFGAPAKDNDNFVLDMATSTVAVGKVSYKLVTSKMLLSAIVFF